MATNLLELYAKISLDDTEFSAGVDKAATKFGGLGKTFTGISNVGKTAFKAVGVAVAAGGAALGAFVKSSVDTGMQFDKSMSQVAATMGYSVDEINTQGSSANQTFQKLRDAAIQYGETTAFTSTQAADALNYMALAGYDAETAMAQLPNVLNLAAAGGLELGYASDMITDSQTALGLTLEETNTLMDQMAVTASKSNTSVGQLGEAILTVGGTAQYMAGGTEELNSVLGVLADNGIKGSEAGTHLRNMILSLSSPTDAGAAALEKLGVSIFDSEGKMRSFSDIFPELNTAMADLTEEQKLQALSDIFNVRDIASANALLGTTSERWEELGGYIEDADGAMATMAETQLDNLAGDVTILNSAMDGLKIAISDEVTPSLRKFAQQGTKYVGRVKKALTDKGWEGALTEVSKILSEMISTFISYLPQIANVALQMIGVFIDGIADNASGIIKAGGMILDNIVRGLGQIRKKIMPVIRQFVPLLIQGFLSFKSQMFQIGLDILTAIFEGIADNIGNIGAIAFNIINSLASSLQTSIPRLAKASRKILTGFKNYIIKNGPKILKIGTDLIKQISESIVDALPDIAKTGAELITSLGKFITDNLPSLLQSGLDIVETIAGAIIDNAPLLIEAGKSFFGNLISALPDLITQVTEFIDSIGSMLSEKLPGLSWVFDNLSTIIVGVTAGFIAFKTAMAIGDLIKTVSSAFAAFNAVLVANPIAIIVTAVAALTAALIYLWNTNEGFREAVINAWEWIKSTAETVWNAIVTAITNAWEWIKTNVANAINAVKTTMSNVWNNIKETISTVWNTIVTTISDVWNSIKLAVSTAIYQVATTLSNVWNNIKETVSTVWEEIRTALSTAWDAIKLVVSTAIYLMANTLSNVWNNIKETASAIWETIKTTISTAWDGIKGAVSTAIYLIANTLNNVWNNIKDTVETVWNTIKTSITNIWNGIKGAVSGAVYQVATTLSNVWNNIKTTVSTIWEGIKSTISSVWDGIKGAVSGAIYQVASTMSNVWNNIKSTVTTMWDGISSKISTTWTNIKTGVTSSISSVKTKLSTAWTSIKDTATTAWNNVRDAILKPVRTAKTKVKNLIDKIKGFFDFEWSLPSLSLPHLTIEGKFSLNPPSVPTFRISWYRKAMENAMILNKPTIFGMSNGQFLGGGEAGPEVVSGADTLMGMIQSAVRSVLAGGGNAPAINVTQNIYSQAQTAADLMLEARWEAERAVLMNV